MVRESNDSYRFSSWLKHERIVRTRGDELLRAFNEGYRPSIIAMHFAALEIQRIFRGHMIRVRYRLPWQPQRVSRIAEIPLDQRFDPLVKPPKDVPDHQLVERYLNYIKKSRSNIDYLNWVASRLQAWWRTVLTRRKYVFLKFKMYNEAAWCVQLAWLDFKKNRLEAYKKPQLRNNAVQLIQNMWRSYMNKRIYRYYRDLIRFRENGNPKMLLKAMNPVEYPLFEQASGLHIRFRLGGESFPPVIYYKIFTHRNVADINAFAPRDYTAERRAEQHAKRQLFNILREISEWHSTGRKQPLPEAHQRVLSQGLWHPDMSALQSRWYKRWENNGWRPVSERILIEPDPIAERTAQLSINFHYSKLQRRQDVERKRKLQRLNWLRQMYGMAEQTVENSDSVIEEENEEDQKLDAECDAFVTKLKKLEAPKIANHIDLKTLEKLETEAEELLAWSDSLDYNLYHENWLSLGTCGRQNIEQILDDDETDHPYNPQPTTKFLDVSLSPGAPPSATTYYTASVTSR